MSSNRYDICLQRYSELSLLLDYYSKDGLEPPCLSTLLEVLIKDPRQHSGLSTLTVSRLWEIMIYQVKFRYDYPSDSDYTVSTPDPSTEFDDDDVTG
ncbi:hypothetical protein sscle_16g109120 [Sclerotinia sclerotiorum 1980 UF-70]|uniref:Uncharacterized protein n=1 Tax=Sclerotinia sclerotiorum (strain ATCC 18683 / 1980 / Ss-1) TaxID=665079 RepID=A0A1D9QMW0_SCLS1|nr:hypothetical protein sscle_16g109120 [Sclerotinia sclerotiorum 1980 UF-70]